MAIKYVYNPFSSNLDAVTNDALLVSGPASSTDNAIVRFDGTTGKLVQDSSVTISDTGDVIITGDLTVNGTTTTIDTTNLDVTDANITVNNGGNNASAEGAGLTVERTSTAGSFIFEAALASKWKLGLLGAEIQVADISSSQTLTNKTINASNNTISNIVDTNIGALAAITLTKLAALTANRAVATGGTGYLVASATTDTELGYLSGVTSAVQTQLNAKLDDFTATSDNRLIRANGVAGDAVQGSGVTLSDLDAFTGATAFTFTTGVTISSFLDEDNMVSDSATAVPTQQSVKAYVDANGLNVLYDVVSISTNTSAADKKTYLVDSSGGTVAVTLPSATTSNFVRVKDSAGAADSNSITVNTGGETIDGAATYVINSEYGSAVFVSDNSDWYLL